MLELLKKKNLNIKENYEQILVEANIAQKMVSVCPASNYVSHLLQALTLYGLKKRNLLIDKNIRERHLKHVPGFLVKMMRLEKYMGVKNG